MSNNIELRHLRYFKALAEELHFGKAANKLFITQPGLSRQIKNLEQELGVLLLIRDKKKVSLTKAGAYFYEEAIFIQNHLEQAVKHLKSIVSGSSGEIRIGFVGSAMQSIIPNILKSLNVAYPLMRTSLEERSNQIQIEGLMHDEIDIGFIRQRKVPDEIEITTVQIDTFSLVLPKVHKVDVSNFTSMAQLRNEAFILFSEKYSPEYHHTVLSICEDEGFTPRISHNTVHASSIYKLVENGLGIAIIPTSLAEGFSLKVKYIELSDIEQRSSLFMAVKKGNRNPALHKFLEVQQNLLS